VSGCSPVIQQKFVVSVLAVAAMVPSSAYTLTWAGPYGAERAPMLSRRGG